MRAHLDVVHGELMTLNGDLGVLTELVDVFV
jgi:hypothetical protein